MSVTNLLGGKLVTKEGEKSTAEILEGKKVLALYFSAHWCPPCRGFTPQLATKYKALQEAGKSFELVFVSSDRDQKSFDEYYQEMPWPALPYAQRDAKAKLSKKFKVGGIPTLVFVDLDTGKTITTEGREAVSKDTFVEDFPYTPQPFDAMQALGDTFVGKDGKIVTKDQAFKGKKVLGLYFSAHWCPPCRGFTPQLADKYDKLKEAGKELEIVFVSSDKDQKAFDEYHKEMPWLALPFDKRDAKSALSAGFNVNGIPTLVFMDLETGETITDEGRAGVSSDSFVEDFPYHPKPVNDVADTVSGINDSASLVVMMESLTAEAKAEVTRTLTEVATEELGKAEPVIEKFFTAKGGGPAGRLRKGCGLGDSEAEGSSKVELIILDLAMDGSYFRPAEPTTNVTADGLRSFIKDFSAEKLERKQFQ